MNDHIHSRPRGFEKEGSSVHDQSGISGIISEFFLHLNNILSKSGVRSNIPDPPPPPRTGYALCTFMKCGVYDCMRDIPVLHLVLSLSPSVSDRRSRTGITN